jgi:hypothetical protein
MPPKMFHNNRNKRRKKMFIIIEEDSFETIKGLQRITITDNPLLLLWEKQRAPLREQHPFLFYMG